jgi:large subunit ribosomal protein L34
MDKTVSFLNPRHSLLKPLLFCYTLAMEKSIKLKKGKRARKHGFLKRSKSHGGKKTLKKRRAAGRKKLTV